MRGSRPTSRCGPPWSSRPASSPSSGGGRVMAQKLIVDTHVHVFTRDMPLIDNPRHSPNYDFTHQQLIATMDAHGVRYAAIAAASPWGDYNDYTIKALRAHPKRLRGTAILKPTVERVTLEAMAKDGMVGVRL